MWVWIPRYAYKITEGYHTNEKGTIEVAFLDTNNNFLNGEQTGKPETDPSKITYTNGVQNQWLVHPAFTANAANGGGFGEIEGLWVGKFEARGTTTSLIVKPGVESFSQMTINQQYKLAKTSTFGETVALQSHMAKNSEWGATVYLGHSKYGTNGAKIEQNTNSSYYTGGSNTKGTIYTTNKTQSSTHNATGIYDLNGGGLESVASYINIGTNLSEAGGTGAGDLWGADSNERATSTAYKMVYEGIGPPKEDYERAKKYKGDAVYETSVEWALKTGAWFYAYACYLDENHPFFARGGVYNHEQSGDFYFGGNLRGSLSFRPMLAP